MDASIFRLINEKLYTKSSTKAMKYFKENKNHFALYHSGYSKQVTKWPKNPLDTICGYIKKFHPDTGVVIDMGCGEAKLCEALPSHTFHNYDLVAINDKVTVCNIKKTPLDDKSADCVVFCLSLMGKDYYKFLIEAKRILKDNGTIFIAELKSRITENKFLFLMRKLGFRNKPLKNVNDYFGVYRFIVRNSEPFIKKEIKKISKEALKPSLYKKR
eukprot:GAHX01002350.1.p1 GENE.GAHX01002350.1~~GAHX01002350.1.p1  ORF type:complete len:215 (+),score=41.02 GAHX01002350.1:55-699(+)